MPIPNLANGGGWARGRKSDFKQSSVKIICWMEDIRRAQAGADKGKRFPSGYNKNELISLTTALKQGRKGNETGLLHVASVTQPSLMTRFRGDITYK